MIPAAIDLPASSFVYNTPTLASDANLASPFGPNKASFTALA